MILKSGKIIDFNFSETPYSIVLQPGKYILEAYGASGGSAGGIYTTARNPETNSCYDQSNVTKYKGNTQCQKKSSQAGSGGYAKGVISLKTQAILYINTGGSGKYGQGDNPGGHNGGGSSCADYSSSGSGGGATDFRLFLNSLYTRILVAGGGGGSDDFDSPPTYQKVNDGTGGSGGLIGQAMWKDGEYQGEEFETGTTKGFSFGQGQKSKSCNGNSEKAGAGGGFFGGYSIDSTSAGAGGGSSFAFSKDITFPKGLIEAKDESGNVIESSYYAFKDSPQYYLTDVEFSTGIWKGDGIARITVVSLTQICHITKNRLLFAFSFLFTTIVLKL